MIVNPIWSIWSTTRGDDISNYKSPSFIKNDPRLTSWKMASANPFLSFHVIIIFMVHGNSWFLLHPSDGALSYIAFPLHLINRNHLRRHLRQDHSDWFNGRRHYGDSNRRCGLWVAKQNDNNHALVPRSHIWSLYSRLVLVPTCLSFCFGKSAMPRTKKSKHERPSS